MLLQQRFPIIILIIAALCILAKGEPIADAGGQTGTTSLRTRQSTSPILVRRRGLGRSGTNDDECHHSKGSPSSKCRSKGMSKRKAKRAMGKGEASKRRSKGPSRSKGGTRSARVRIWEEVILDEIFGHGHEEDFSFSYGGKATKSSGKGAKSSDDGCDCGCECVEGEDCHCICHCVEEPSGSSKGKGGKHSRGKAGTKKGKGGGEGGKKMKGKGSNPFHTFSGTKSRKGGASERSSIVW